MNATTTMDAVVALSAETVQAHRKLADRATAFHARLVGSEFVRQAVAVMAHDESEASGLLDTLNPHVSTIADFATALRLVMSAQAIS